MTSEDAYTVAAELAAKATTPEEREEAARWYEIAAELRDREQN